MNNIRKVWTISCRMRPIASNSVMPSALWLHFKTKRIHGFWRTQRILTGKGGVLLRIWEPIKDLAWNFSFFLISIRKCFLYPSSLLQILFLWSATFLCARCSVFFLTSGQTQPRVKKEKEVVQKKANIRRKRQGVKRKSKTSFGRQRSPTSHLLIAAQLTKLGKVSDVPIVRKFLIQKKKLARKDQKTVTETNVVEKWAELYCCNTLG